MSETKPNRSDFIRQHPDLSPAELVELGAKQGLNFSKNLIYLVRGPRTAKATAKTAPRRGDRAPAKSATAPSIPQSPRETGKHDSQDTEAFARLVFAIGFDRAEQLLSRLRAAIG